MHGSDMDATRQDSRRLVPEGSRASLLGADSSTATMRYHSTFVHVTQISCRVNSDEPQSTVTVCDESSFGTLPDAGSWLRTWADYNPLMYWSTVLVIYVTDGCLTLDIEGHGVPFPTGSACVLGKGIGYRFTVETDYDAFCISVSDGLFVDVFGTELLGYATEGPYDGSTLDVVRLLSRPDFEGYVDFIPRDLGQGSATDEQVAAAGIVDALRRRVCGMRYEVKHLMCRLTEGLLLSGRYEVQHVRHTARFGRAVFNRIDRIIQIRDGVVRRRDLAELFSYSGTYVGLLVKRYTGMALYDYCMTFTMKAAARRLAETDEPVGSITESLGFSSRTHFNHLFKEAHGMTPSEYRRTSRG